MMEDLPRASPEPKVARIERRRTVGETPSGTWTPRAKPVAIACERCRRRKIRCDGETPCATCRRFSLNCIRPQKGSEGQAALEQRVRQLEARILELSTGLSNSQVSHQLDNGPTGSQGPPSLHLFTDLAALDYIDSHESYGQPFLDSNPAPFEIPRIEVVDYATMSPMSLPTSPSMCSPMSSTPNPPSSAFDGRLQPPNPGLALSPPISACPSASYNVVPRLSPTGFAEPTHSRRSSISSSISSLGLDADYAAPDFRMIDAEEELGQVLLKSCLEFETNMRSMPTSVEIQALLENFVQTVPGMGYPFGLDMFQKFLDIIDDPLQVPSGQRATYSVSMAKFHVYMAMAVGLRMKVDCRARELQLLETCYDVAVEQIRSPYFWAQPLAGEAAILLMLFANASHQSSVS
ncbi:hypothetical protein BJX96DRAFT_160796 [Aspergillus floccosus]